jgi:predicted transcriptional regulator
MADMKKQAFALSFVSKLVVLAAHKLRYNLTILHGDKLATFSIVMTSHVIVMTY